MKTGERLDCPFCAFTDQDHYFLPQHVETTHPESGRPSPFAVIEELTPRVEPPAREMEGARDNSSGYIECHCGEFCLLTEFESHLEMHNAEGMGLDEASRASAGSAATPESTLHLGKTMSPQTEVSSATPLHIVKSGPSQPIPVRSVLEHSNHSASRKSGNTIRDFIDVLRHSASPPFRKPSQAARNKIPRRLGVCDSSSNFCNYIC